MTAPETGGTIEPRRGQMAEALARLFGISAAQAGFELPLELTMRPMLQMLDVSDSPYLTFGIGVMANHGITPPVTDQGYVWASPGKGVALQILQIIVPNDDTAAGHSYTLRTMSATDIANVGIDATQQMLEVAGPLQFSSNRSSSVSMGSRVAASGKLCGRIFVPAGSTVTIDLPKPGIIMMGSDPRGIPGFTVRCETLGAVCRATFVGREWPLPVP